MISRLPVALVAASVAVAGVSVLAGCAPEPEPTVQPLFATEAEAFAAAEEVYREYTRAANEVRAGGAPSSDPFEFVSGRALQADIDAASYLQTNGLRLDGPTDIASFHHLDATLGSEPVQVRMAACLDARAVQLLDSADADVTPSDREEVAPLLVTFSAIDGRLLITGSEETAVVKC